MTCKIVTWFGHYTENKHDNNNNKNKQLWVSKPYVPLTPGSSNWTDVGTLE